jgi:hypothetical protein
MRLKRNSYRTGRGAAPTRLPRVCGQEHRARIHQVFGVQCPRPK